MQTAPFGRKPMFRLMTYRFLIVHLILKRTVILIKRIRESRVWFALQVVVVAAASEALSCFKQP